MRIVSKSKCDELEIIKIYISLGFTITVQVFNVPEGYKSLASNSFVPPNDLEGYGFSKNKKESVKQASNELREMVEAVPV